MSPTCRKPTLIYQVLCGALLWLSVAAVGCQVNVGGQTLPSGYYLDDDVQYFAEGPEFPLANEAAAQAMRRAEAQRAANR